MNDSPTIDLISGCVGGISGIIGCHPFDTVKCRLQVHSDKYRNGVHCFTKIIREETLNKRGKYLWLGAGSNSGCLNVSCEFRMSGLACYGSHPALADVTVEFAPSYVRGLYKGVLPPVVMQGTINAIVFGVYGPLSRCLNSKLKGTRYGEEMSAMLSGMSAGLFQSLVCAPMELVKLRVQNKAIGLNTRYEGNWATLRDTYRAGKLTGVYKGLFVTAFRDLVGFGVYFAVYESLMNFSARKRQEERGDLGSIFPFINGGLAGVSSWIVNFPVDTVKSRYQVDGAEKRLPIYYDSARDCFSKTLKEGGWRLLYRGFSMGILRAFVCNAFLFPAYEYTKSVLVKLEYW